MSKLVITGWKNGCNTVAAIKEIRARTPMPLNEALALVNKVLRNEEVEFFVSAASEAQALVNSLESVGIVAKTTED